MTNPLIDIQLDQQEFNEACDVKSFSIVEVIDGSKTDNPEFDVELRRQIQLAIALVKEECTREYIPALEKLISNTYKGDPIEITTTLTEIYDGGIDTIYVIMWLFNVLDLPFAEGWQEVHHSNMQKTSIDPVRGGLKIKRRADGKILKPEGWKPPDLRNILLKHYDRKK